MKIEQLLVQHFYNAKQVTLQGMGTFNLSPDFVMPIENDKDVTIPAGAINFQYNSKATEDGSLIGFIMQQTRKIKPLASSDLESYIMLATQFLNIGKPFKIDGIGTLEKNQQGQYDFTQQGQYLNAKSEEAQVKLKEKLDDDISFTSKSKPSSKNNGTKIVTILATLLALTCIGGGAWYFFTKKSEAETVVIHKTPIVTKPETDTSKIISQQKPDTSVSIKPVPNIAAGNYTFKVVFKETIDKDAANAKMKKLSDWGHKVIMYTKDSLTYKLAEPFALPLSDTTKIKDSLNRYYYAGKAVIELN